MWGGVARAAAGPAARPRSKARTGHGAPSRVPFGLMFWIIPNGRGRLPHPNRLNQRPSAVGPPELQ